MKLYGAVETGETTSAQPGTIVLAGKQGIDIACGDGKVLRVTELQAQGSKRMTAAAYLLGHPIQH
jgi:methionyl-tRNA formyltransferase